jgi:hypothetical protein
MSATEMTAFVALMLITFAAALAGEWWEIRDEMRNADRRAGKLFVGYVERGSRWMLRFALIVLTLELVHTLPQFLDAQVGPPQEQQAAPKHRRETDQVSEVETRAGGCVAHSVSARQADEREQPRQAIAPMGCLGQQQCQHYAAEPQQCVHPTPFFTPRPKSTGGLPA